MVFLNKVDRLKIEVVDFVRGLSQDLNQWMGTSSSRVQTAGFWHSESIEERDDVF